MPPPDPARLLADWRRGDRAALDELFPIVYQELRRRARAYLRNQPGAETLTTTALVHETYLKLVGATALTWKDRAHFMALAARAMRQVLISYARRNRAAKRGGGVVKIELDSQPSLTDFAADQFLALNDALEQLAILNERLSRTVELRFFGGMSLEETAEVIGVSPSTVKLDWQKARAWLYRELGQS